MKKLKRKQTLYYKIIFKIFFQTPIFIFLFFFIFETEEVWGWCTVY